MSGNFLSCIRVSRTLSRLKGKVGCLLRSHIVKVPHLVLRVQSPSFSRVAAGKLGFLSSYNGEFWDPLVWPQESPVSMRVARGLGIPLQSLPGLRSSSEVLAETSGFLFSADMDLGDPLEFPQGSQASSHVETCKSAFLSTWKSSVRLPLEFTQESVAFSRGATGLSHMPLCFESILGVTVQSVQGSLLDRDWIGTSGSFRMVVLPLKILSKFNLRPSSLEVRREHRDSFPDEAG